MPCAFALAQLVRRTVTTALSALVVLSLLLGLVPLSATAQSAFEQQVQKMYVAYYGRPGDPAGVDYWAGELVAVGGNWIPALVAAFGNSEEYRSRFGALHDETLINNLFVGLFNRSADPAGLSYYVDLLNGSNVSGYNPAMRQSTLAQIALDIANGVTSGSTDSTTLNNKLSVAGSFTDALRASGGAYGSSEIQAAVDLVAAVDDQSASVTEAQAVIALLTTSAFPSEEVAKVTANDRHFEDNFGWAVALDGDTALIGGGGQAYVFTRSGTSWNQQATLISSEVDDWFGRAVALDGNTALLGAPMHDYESNSIHSPRTWKRYDPIGSFINRIPVDPGAVYVYTFDGAIWRELSKLFASDVSGLAAFGQAVALDGDTLLIGAPNWKTYDDGSAWGSSYFFR